MGRDKGPSRRCNPSKGNAAKEKKDKDGRPLFFHLPVSLISSCVYERVCKRKNTHELSQQHGKDSRTVLRLLVFSGQSRWPSMEFC